MKTITFLFAGALALLAVPARAALVWANSSYRQVITATGSVSGGSVANITVTYGAAERSFDGGNTWEPYNGAVFGGVAVQMWIGDGPNAGYYVGYSTISGTSGNSARIDRSAGMFCGPMALPMGAHQGISTWQPARSNRSPTTRSSVV